MEIIIITGMSGAGKTSALNIVQDNGYLAIDNLPPKLIPECIDVVTQQKNKVEKMAFVIDIRLGEHLEDVAYIVENLRNIGHHVKVIYMDANDDELVRRYQEKRRPHPYNDLSLTNAIKKEREVLLSVREITDEYIDTSSNNTSQLTNRLLSILEVDNEIFIKITSFGFKYGILKEADYVFDTRFINNPFYIKGLKHKTGLDKEVQDYVMNYEGVDGFVQKIKELIDFVGPGFVEQGKANLVIGIGCTGGQHRSVTIAEKLYEILSEDKKCEVFHREINKWH